MGDQYILYLLFKALFRSLAGSEDFLLGALQTEVQN